MKNIIKLFMVSLVLTVAFAMVSSTAIAQFPLGMVDFPEFFQQPLQVPTQILGGLLIDNFEYWDSPYNHGWIQIEPPYPVYGYGIGYATIFNTVLDLQEGSRVLDVYRPSSVFLLGPKPFEPYAKHAIRYPCGNGCLGINLQQYPILSFKFRAPLGIEFWDIFEFRVYYSCPVNPYGNYIRIVPLQGQPCANCGGYTISGPDANGIYTISIGREFLDGTWHVVWLDLLKMTNGAVTTVTALEASGQMFRMDDVMFKQTDQHLCEPYLFKIGPRYAQFYEPYAYLFYADYRDFCGPAITDLLLMDSAYRMPYDPNYAGPNQNLFETDPQKITDYWVSMGADPNYLDPNNALYGTPEPTVSALMGKPMILNLNMPIFSDPNIGYNPATGTPSVKNPAFMPVVLGSAAGQTNQTFLWNATVGGIGSSGVEFEGVTPLPIDPFDGMPTYIPTYGPLTTLTVSSITGRSFFGPETIAALESALYYAGFSHWPGIAVLYYTPYTFEDIILTLEVTNGRTSDFETFPISVLNFPQENYPPYIEDVDDQFFPVGQQNFYAMSAVDPDNFIFSLAGPATTGTLPATSHMPLPYPIRRDMEQLAWQMTLNGLPSYQYGPWMQSIINPCNGLVSFIPQFEGAYDAIVTATDPFGASAIAEFTIFSVTPGTWLNHPPIILMDWDHPQVAKAGEEFILSTPELQIIDPDGDELYFSTNLGSVGYDSRGNFMWAFTTNFPGFYTAEIIAYDIRGGYAIITVDVEVKPWWTF